MVIFGLKMLERHKFSTVSCVPPASARMPPNSAHAEVSRALPPRLHVVRATRTRSRFCGHLMSFQPHMYAGHEVLMATSATSQCSYDASFFAHFTVFARWLTTPHDGSTYSLAHSHLAHSLTYAPTRPLIQPLVRSLAHSVRPPFCSLAHLLARSLCGLQGYSHCSQECSQGPSLGDREALGVC
jgi:hypothetical protein